MDAKRDLAGQVGGLQQAMPDPEGQAQFCAWIYRFLCTGVAPEVVDGQIAAGLATMTVLTMAMNLQLKLGIDLDQARAMAIGWIAAKAQEAAT